MEQLLLSLLGTAVCGAFGFLYKQMRNLTVELNKLESNLMMRDEIIAHVDREISHVRGDLKDTTASILRHVEAVNGKIDIIMTAIVQKGMNDGNR